jgi:hypothetical protein
VNCFADNDYRARGGDYGAAFVILRKCAMPELPDAAGSQPALPTEELQEPFECTSIPRLRAVMTAIC